MDQNGMKNNDQARALERVRKMLALANDAGIPHRPPIPGTHARR